ncbi:MAG: ion transporter [Lachnospiraceae bacterium]|nr:ion transporter [Lachnospiraceae bacterium]
MENKKKRIFHIIQIGTNDDFISRAFDIVIVCAIFLNLFAVFFDTFDVSKDFKTPLAVIEWGTVVFFTIEYLLRLWTADYLYPKRSYWGAKVAFVFSFFGMIDLLAILPTYLPLVFPAGAVAFRMFRVIRIFRLFKVNAKYDAFNVIVDVLKDKRKQLFSSIIMILILMVAASLCMYSLENEAQPGVFKNAFSGIWWSASTILTIGYGDIAPITTAGKIMSMVISFLGVGMVAVPTGIISAGFVEQYQRVRYVGEAAEEQKIRFVTSVVGAKHPYVGKLVKDIAFPPQLLLVVVLRKKDAGEEEIVPDGELRIMANDVLVFAAPNFDDTRKIDLREIKINAEHPWVGKMIRDLDISRLELIVSIERRGRTVIPNGRTVIKKDDTLLVYSKKG